MSIHMTLDWYERPLKGLAKHIIASRHTVIMDDLNDYLNEYS